MSRDEISDAANLGVAERRSESLSRHRSHSDASNRPERSESEKGRKSTSFYLSFLALNISVFIVSLDITALSVAMPIITHDLRGTTLEAFWTNMSFNLAVVVTQPIFSSISEVLGRKAPFYASFVLFAVGSIVFAVAKSMAVLIGGRILQGLGAGGLDVLGEVILADITTLKERPLYLGLFALPMAGGGVCGPMIGAALSEFASWRWIGWINLPIVAVGLLLTFFFLRLRPIEKSLRSKIRTLDWLGMLLFTFGSTALALPLSWAGAMYPWSSWRTIVPLMVGIVILFGFGAYERKPVEPIIPLRILRGTTAIVTLVGATIHGAIFYSILQYIPLFYQSVFLETPFRSAVSLLPFGVTTVGLSIISAIAVGVVGHYRWIIIVNWVLTACGVGLWALWQQSSTSALKYGLQVLPGIGLGTLFTVLSIPMQASVDDPDDMGIAAGTIVSFRLFGGLLGLAISSTIFYNVFGLKIPAPSSLPPSMAVLGDIRESISFIPALRTQGQQSSILSQIIEAYRLSVMAVFLGLAGLGTLGLLTSFFTKDLTLDSDHLGRQRLEKPS